MLRPNVRLSPLLSFVSFLPSSPSPSSFESESAFLPHRRHVTLTLFAFLSQLPHPHSHPRSHFLILIPLSIAMTQSILDTHFIIFLTPLTHTVPRLDLHFAAASGNLGLVEYALSHGQPINSVLNGVLPLHAACAGGSEVVVKYLIDEGADVNAPRCVLPSLRIIENRVELIEFFIITISTNLNLNLGWTWFGLVWIGDRFRSFHWNLGMDLGYRANTRMINTSRPGWLLERVVSCLFLFFLSSFFPLPRQKHLALRYAAVPFVHIGLGRLVEMCVLKGRLFVA